MSDRSLLPKKSQTAAVLQRELEAARKLHAQKEQALKFDYNNLEHEVWKALGSRTPPDDIKNKRREALVALAKETRERAAHVDKRLTEAVEELRERRAQIDGVRAELGVLRALVEQLTAEREQVAGALSKMVGTNIHANDIVLVVRQLVEGRLQTLKLGLWIAASALRRGIGR